MSCPLTNQSQVLEGMGTWVLFANVQLLTGAAVLTAMAVMVSQCAIEEAWT